MPSHSEPALVPLRGEVWLCAVPVAGPHPVLILTVNRIAAPLTALTVALITGSRGPSETHVWIGPDAGLLKYDESFVNCTDIHTVDKLRLRRRLGRLSHEEMAAVEARLRLTLGL